MGSQVRITSGRVIRTSRTASASARPWSQFASDRCGSCPAVSCPPRYQTFVIPRVARSRSPSVRRIRPSDVPRSAPAWLPPESPLVMKITATRRFSSPIARARYGPASVSSSGCATSRRRSAFKRSSGFCGLHVRGDCAERVLTSAVTVIRMTNESRSRWRSMAPVYSEVDGASAPKRTGARDVPRARVPAAPRTGTAGSTECPAGRSSA